MQHTPPSRLHGNIRMSFSVEFFVHHLHVFVNKVINFISSAIPSVPTQCAIEVAAGEKETAAVAQKLHVTKACGGIRTCCCRFEGVHVDLLRSSAGKRNKGDREQSL